MLPSSCSLVSQRKICTAIKLRLIAVRSFVLVSRTASSFYAFAFLGYVMRACSEIRGMVPRVHPVLISKRAFLNRPTFGPVVSRVASNALTLSLGFADSKLLRDKAIFDDLIDVLFLRKWPLIIEI